MCKNIRYIFHYDSGKPAWHNHSKLLAHDCSVCVVLDAEDINELGIYDMVRVKFADGYESNVMVTELEAIELIAEED